MRSCIVIPARLHSSRLHEKVLQDIHGKPMVQWVYESALQVDHVEKVFIAVDDEKVFDACIKFGGEPIFTSRDHVSGTDRLIEVMHMVEEYDIYINLQADEPMMKPETLYDLNLYLQTNDVGIATMYENLSDESELFDFNVVKLVKDRNQKVLYFSRNAIPAFRDKPYKDWFNLHQYFRHVGIYGFRRNALLKIEILQPTSLEKSESLEQLRWLENGLEIHCIKCNYTNKGVDTINDLETVRKLMNNR